MPDELAGERALNQLYEEKARRKPVTERPSVLIERHEERPGSHVKRERVGWFLAL
jgi:hypothetical protein